MITSTSAPQITHPAPAATPVVATPPDEEGEKADRVTELVDGSPVADAKAASEGPEHFGGYYGYGTRVLLNRFCIPDAGKLPAQINETKYKTLIGEMGIDDF